MVEKQSGNTLVIPKMEGMSEKKREVMQSSFSMVDEFERDLWEWATKPEHGAPSLFIKRLIVQERERQTSKSIVVEKFAELVEYVEPVNVDENKAAAKGFL